METITYIGLAIGIILIAFELFLPGGVAFCVGLGFMGTSVLYHFHIVRDPASVFMTLTLSSLVLSSIGVWVTSRLFSGDSTKGSLNEDAMAFGSEVEVVEDTDSSGGRIFFNGTTWKALCYEQTIPEGGKAVIVCRDNITWIIEPAETQFKKESV